MNNFLLYPVALFQYLMLHLWLIDFDRYNQHIDNNAAETIENYEDDQVRIIAPKPESTINWETSLRYHLAVLDDVGNDLSTEITPTDVTLEIEFVPLNAESNTQLNNHLGLKLLSRNNCFSCHADKDHMIGPSFEQISAKYGQQGAKPEQLAESIVKGSAGKWGDYEMPAYQHISEDDARNIVDYIIKQGGEMHRWVYPGLKGVLNLKPKPVGEPSGKLLLTANCGDHHHSISLLIE